MRHKVPYFRDTAPQGSDLPDGVTERQTMADASDVFDKERLERSISKDGRDKDALLVPQPFTDF